MAAQKIASKFRLTVGAGKATPQPPVGSALGQRGLKLMDFCKDFNDRTSHIVDGTPVQVHCASSIVLASAATDWMDTNVQVEVTAYADRTFSFKTALPKSSYFLKLAAGLDKGASKPGQEVAGKISVKHIYEIAKVHGVLRAASCPTPTICHSLPLPPLFGLCLLQLKQQDMPGLSLKSICWMLVGSCRSIGLQVINKEAKGGKSKR
jgi:large subunit ribosomal protein L11